MQKTFNVTLKDKDSEWTNQYSVDTYEIDFTVYFQNMINRWNEQWESRYGNNLGFSTLVRVEEVKEGKEPEKPEANPIATWSISLDVFCPACKEDVDLLDREDFWEVRKLSACETHTERSRDVEVVCPKCHHEFKVDLEF
jgi:hypothetical protein